MLSGSIHGSGRQWPGGNHGSRWNGGRRPLGRGSRSIVASRRGSQPLTQFCAATSQLVPCRTSGIAGWAAYPLAHRLWRSDVSWRHVRPQGQGASFRRDCWLMCATAGTLLQQQAAIPKEFRLHDRWAHTHIYIYIYIFIYMTYIFIYVYIYVCMYI